MSTTTSTGATRHELASRVNGDLEITLFWDRHDNSTSIDLRHSAIDETISFNVPPDHALDAFHHPFAHLEQRLWRSTRPSNGSFAGSYE